MIIRTSIWDQMLRLIVMPVKIQSGLRVRNFYTVLKDATRIIAQSASIRPSKKCLRKNLSLKKSKKNVA